MLLFKSEFAMQLLAWALYYALSEKKNLNLVKSKQARIVYVKAFDGEMALAE